MGIWHFWVDRGGTFTDVVARTPDGEMVTAKLLSEDPERYDDAAVAAIRMLTGCPSGPLPPAEIRIGTTIATNALLERKGEPVLLAITRGFADALVIGTQDRPDIFARHIVRPPPLHAEVIEITPSRSKPDRGIARVRSGEVHDDEWQALGPACLACTGCTSVCPTCSCFAVVDEASTPDAGSRVRVWDSCLLEGFQREASGHHPAPRPGDRVRRFWYHKLSSDFVPACRRIGCVGCGRCDVTCPGSIGALSVLRRLGA